MDTSTVVSTSSKAKLGSPLLGNWLWSLEHRKKTDEMVQAYLEHHRNDSNENTDTMIPG